MVKIDGVCTKHKSLRFINLDVDKLTLDTAHLSSEEFGAYERLLNSMWRIGGSIPNDDIDLPRIAGVARQRWQAVKKRIMPLMIYLPDEDRLTDQRVIDGLQWVASRKQRRSDTQEPMQSDRGGASSDVNDLGHTRKVSVRVKENKRERRSRASPAPDNAVLSDGLYEMATASGVHGREEAEAEFQKFLDYYRMNGKPLADWNAGWRNWLRKRAQFEAKAKETYRGPGGRADIDFCERKAAEYRAKAAAEGATVIDITNYWETSK